MRIFWFFFVFFSLLVVRPTYAVIVPTDYLTPSITPSVTMTPSVTPSVTPGVIPTISITPSVSVTPSVLPIVSPSQPLCSDIKINENVLGFKIPTFSDLLTFAIRGFFTIAGLAALFMLLMGALDWVTSGGAKDKVEGAQKKITSAIVGMIMIVVVLAIVWTMENIVFNRRICFGISCGVTIPSLIKPTATRPDTNCITGTPVPNQFFTPTPPISGAEPLFRSDLFQRESGGQGFSLPATGK